MNLGVVHPLHALHVALLLFGSLLIRGLGAHLHVFHSVIAVALLRCGKRGQN